MKKRIAVLANGWNSENLSNFMMGIEKNVKPGSMDFFVFLSFASYGYNEINRKAEALIYELPNLKTFDAVIIFGPGLNFQDVIEKIQKMADNAGIPVISIGIKHPGHHFIGADNYVGMKELVDHMIEKHACRKMLFVAGSRENEDSNIRLKAIKDSMKEHKLKFGANDVFYSEWEAKKAMAYITRTYKSPADFPDAFLCANDGLALAVSQLMESHYKLNINDVKICGFDHLDSSKIYYPSISTVDQEYEKIGARASEMLEKIFEGKKAADEVMVPCRFIVGESCGCGYSKKAMMARKSYIRRQQMESRFALNKEGRLFSIERAIFQGQNYAEVKKGVRKLLYGESGSEGNTFYIMFDPVLEKIGEKEESLLPRFSLDESYLVLCGKKDGIPVTSEMVNCSQIIPDYTGTGANTIYLIANLHYEDLMCGYFVSGTDAENIRNLDFSNYQTRLDRSFFTYIKNLQLNTLNKKLADLMEQDSLTHVKNRTAYDKYIKAFQKKVDSGEKTEYAVAYFDINDLKVINDKYGHESGDAYIRNSCKLICDTFKHSPVFRIGGDEFLCIVYNDDFKMRDELLRSMKEEMETRKAAGDMYSPAAVVSIASGMAVFDPETDKDILSVVNRADVLMYEEKARMKRGNIR